MRRVIGLATAAFVVAFMLIEPPAPQPEPQGAQRAGKQAQKPETFSLVHAIGNNERISAKGLSKEECYKRRGELRGVAAGMGTGGSITCLPDSVYGR